MKKIILSAVLIFTVLIQNFASAANYNSVDWSTAPTFSTKADFAKYIRNCEYNCKSFIPVIFSNGLFVDAEEFLQISKNSQNVTINWWNDGKGRVIYETNLYPGAKIAYAYRTGNNSILSNEEKRLYNIAVQIVNAAKQQPTTLRKELYIHDQITERVSYYNVTNNEKAPRHCTAIGALIDGRANCQGYSDAFYMLGRMAGFKIDKMTGKASGDPHVWNTIDFGGGKIYGVDVTFDDVSYAFDQNNQYNGYIYFNVPIEILKATHSWSATHNPKLQAVIDERYFFATSEFYSTSGKYFGFYSQSAENALDYIAKRIANESRRFSMGMAPYDRNYADTRFSLNRLVKDILPNKYNWAGNVKMSVARRGNWIFYTVEATSK